MAWLVFAVAVYALPLFIGVAAGIAAHSSEAGAIGAVVVGFVVGVPALACGQLALATVRAPILRLLILAIYIMPAGLAGYGIGRNLAGFGVQNSAWRTVFAVAGALVTMATTAARLTRITGIGVATLACRWRSSGADLTHRRPLRFGGTGTPVGLGRGAADPVTSHFPGPSRLAERHARGGKSDAIRTAVSSRLGLIMGFDTASVVRTVKVMMGATEFLSRHGPAPRRLCDGLIWPMAGCASLA